MHSESALCQNLGSRDRYIGWSAEARQRNIRFIGYNTRFLMLPWVTVFIWLRICSATWPGSYRRIGSAFTGTPSIFWKPSWPRNGFGGTSYRAANWALLGHTTGRRKDDHTNRPNRSIKEILGYRCTGGSGSYWRRRNDEAASPEGTRRIDVSTVELEALLEQGRPSLSEDGYQKLRTPIRTLGYVTELLEKRETTLAKLRELFCPASTEKTETVLKQAGVDTGEKKSKTAAGNSRKKQDMGALALRIAHRGDQYAERLLMTIKVLCLYAAFYYTAKSDSLRLLLNRETFTPDFLIVSGVVDGNSSLTADFKRSLEILSVKYESVQGGNMSSRAETMRHPRGIAPVKALPRMAN